ncbi:MAG: cell division protein FtsL [Halothiobacillaceae bacterium]|jgi:cell division protein FtsL|nr:cell division protein FtsL [Halothiobacillaceae bacterium]MDY0050582.1 cell division protein FtsL [Halothiobacillaceae bacterium]
MNWVVALLGAAVIGSGVAVVHAEYMGRAYLAALTVEQHERDELEADWGRLQLEEGALAAHGRVETLARERLDMRPPEGADMVMVWR